MQANFYVATDGSDSNPGTIDKPFATLERARDAVRKMKSSSAFQHMFSPQDKGRPVTVMIRAGRYQLSEPLIFGPEDSGTKEHPVLYTAYSDERVVISGGKKIVGWKKAHGKLWKAELADVKSGKWYFRQLFVNGKRVHRAKIPNKGYYELVSLIDPDNREDPINLTGFRFKPGDLNADWTNLEDVEILKLFRWGETRLPIAEVDETEHIVTFHGSTSTCGGSRLFDWCGNRYFIDNVYEGLDSPGQWYLNRKTGCLYYWPLEAEDMTTAEIIAPLLSQLIHFKGDVDARKFVEHITIKDVELCHCDWTLPKTGYDETLAEVWIPSENNPGGRPTGAICADGALFCSLEDNVIDHVGGFAIELGRGCKDIRIVGNRIFDLAGGGIKIGQPILITNDVDETSRTLVSDNCIYDGCHVYPGAVGIWIGQSSGNVISHNEIYDMKYSGIYGSNFQRQNHRYKNNTYEYNHIHNLMEEAIVDDGGGIYSFGLSDKITIRNNLIHDIQPRNHKDGLYRGLYLDERSSGMLVQNNIVYNTLNSTCFGQGGNVIENNIFVDGRLSQIWFFPGKGIGGGDTFTRNIVYYTEPSAALYLFYLISTTEHLTNALARSDYNLLYHTSGNDLRMADFPFAETFSQWKAMGYEAHSVVADPLFVDYANKDFRLKSDSPALKLGFKPIDMSTVGPRPKDRFKK